MRLMDQVAAKPVTESVAVTKIPFVDLRAQYRSIESDVRAAITNVLESSAFILGPDVEAFEKAFARYCGAAHCVGVSSGTAALKLALEALGVGRSDEVILPANTYIASALAVSSIGAVPVLVDIDEGYQPSPEAIEKAITARTRAIMPVHLYGKAIDLLPILALARRHGLFVIEDACQAHGAVLDGRRAGSVGHVGCFSFYPGKNLGAYGDAGAVVTKDAAIADKARLLRDFGQRRKYEHLIKGENDRLDTLQAAVLSVKLGRLDEWNARRIRLASLYDRLLAEAGVEVPDRHKDGSDVFHLYVVEVPDRDAVKARLQAAGIETGIHYPTPIHLQPAYADMECGPGSFPRSEVTAKRLLSLPMFPELSEDDVARVATAIGACVASPV